VKNTTARLILRGEGILVGASKRSCCYWPSTTGLGPHSRIGQSVLFDARWRPPGKPSRRGGCSISIARLPARRVVASIRNAHHKTPQTHQARDASGAARPSPNEPPETSLKPGPSLLRGVLCPPARRGGWSLSREAAHARRQPPATLDGRPAAPTTLKKSPGPRRAPAPRTGQPKGARRL